MKLFAQTHRGTLIVDPEYLCSTIINLPIIENVMFTADSDFDIATYKIRNLRS